MPANSMAGTLLTYCLAKGVLAPNRIAAANAASTGGGKYNGDLLLMVILAIQSATYDAIAI
jgi:hypothetical protein